MEWTTFIAIVIRERLFNYWEGKYVEKGGGGSGKRDMKYAHTKILKIYNLTRYFSTRTFSTV